MTEQLDEFRDALASGDPDEVNPAIEQLKEMDAEERAAVFDDAFEMCLALYEEGGGYQRQSVVRFARELAPRRRLFDVLDRADSEAELSDHLMPGDTEQALDRLEEFYLTALDDDDGRVRRAAIKGLKNLTVAYQMTGFRGRIDEILARLDDMMGEASGKKLEHVQRARRDAQLGRGPTLEEMISGGPNDG